MIDLDKIGQRIKEERKYIMKVSQEHMAEDLNMYQADISNMEKAKSGSGISDLIKLDLIAEYFNIPLETLLFGREDKNMLCYHGDQMKLKPSKKKMTKGHLTVLQKLTGQKDRDELPAITYECGPYIIYTMIEQQMSFGAESTAEDIEAQRPDFLLSKFHTFVFFGTELIGVMVADLTTVMQHVFQPHLQKLQMMIQPDVLDVTDVWRTLNPYWALWRFSEEGPEQDSYYEKMFERMDAIRKTGEDRPVLYLENIYVREDCRQHGIFRMYIDLLKEMFQGCIMWLNMEPTSGEELDNEYSCVPSYTVSDLGQLNINAAIAEKVGFKVDPDTWHRQAETTDAEGNITVETVLVRKCAYFMPAEIRELLKDDGELVAQGRAMQKVVQSHDDSSCGGMVDVNHGYIGEDLAAEVRISSPTGEAYYATASISKLGNWRGVISKTSLLRDKKEVIIEEYSSIDDIDNSEYCSDLQMAHSMLMMAIPEDYFDPSLFEDCEEEEPENFDIINDISCTITDAENQAVAEILEVELKRTNTDNIGETLYAMVMVQTDGTAYYALNRKSLSQVDPNQPDFWEELDPVVEFNGDEELAGSKYCPIFHTIREHM